jgi:dephospho-CoA kinase
MTGAAVLITGMSAVGKSTVLADLGRRGHRVVDTDDGDWIDRSGPEPLWREQMITALLDANRDGALFVAGALANQGRFYPRFDAIVLLSVPRDVLLERLAARTTNDFDKADDQRQRILSDLGEIEPLLRRGATDEIDTREPLGQVADRLEAVARGGRHPPHM